MVPGSAMPLGHRGVGRRSASPVVVPEGPPSKLERRLQVDTSFECPATELTPVRPERLPSEAARRWSCSRASALTHQRGPRSGRIRGWAKKATGPEGDRFPLVHTCTVSIFANWNGCEREGCCGCRSQDPSTSSRSLAYKDPSLQKLRVSVIDPSRGMTACAATGAVVSAYEPVNL